MSLVTAQYRVNYFAVLQLNRRQGSMEHQSAYWQRPGSSVLWADPPLQRVFWP